MFISEGETDKMIGCVFTQLIFMIFWWKWNKTMKTPLEVINYRCDWGYNQQGVLQDDENTKNWNQILFQYKEIQIVLFYLSEVQEILWRSEVQESCSWAVQLIRSWVWKWLRCDVFWYFCKYAYKNKVCELYWLECEQISVAVWLWWGCLEEYPSERCEIYKYIKNIHYTYAWRPCFGVAESADLFEQSGQREKLWKQNWDVFW